MSTGRVQVYYGAGRGKTAAALGYAIREAGNAGSSVIIIQFLKEKNEDELAIFRRLEPEIRMFRFQKSAKLYSSLTEEEQFEEQMNMKNGLNFARKVLLTGECSTLILDEVLGLVDLGVIEEAELAKLIAGKSDETDLILTGSNLPEGLIPDVDDIFEIRVKKKS